MWRAILSQYLSFDKKSGKFPQEVVMGVGMGSSIEKTVGVAMFVGRRPRSRCPQGDPCRQPRVRKSKSVSSFSHFNPESSWTTTLSEELWVKLSLQDSSSCSGFPFLLKSSLRTGHKDLWSQILLMCSRYYWESWSNKWRCGSFFLPLENNECFLLTTAWWTRN